MISFDIIEKQTKFLAVQLNIINDVNDPEFQVKCFEDKTWQYCEIELQRFYNTITYKNKFCEILLTHDNLKGTVNNLSINNLIPQLHILQNAIK